MKGKKQIKPNDLSDKKKMLILEKYMDGATSSDLAAEYNILQVTMDKFIGNVCRKLNIIRETNALSNAELVQENLPEGTIVQVSYNNPELINSQFLDLLSADGDLTLSEREKAYAFMYAKTGNNVKALVSSGLDIGLKTTEHIQMTIHHALMLRGYFLRQRPMVASAINLLQDEMLSSTAVNKDYLQISLLQQIEELKEQAADDPKYRTLLLKSLELLGKTIGGFSENITVTTASPADTLDAMIRMAENAKGVYEPIN
jgi:hypothetical protein